MNFLIGKKHQFTMRVIIIKGKNRLFVKSNQLVQAWDASEPLNIPDEFKLIKIKKFKKSTDEIKTLVLISCTFSFLGHLNFLPPFKKLTFSDEAYGFQPVHQQQNNKKMLEREYLGHVEIGDIKNVSIEVLICTRAVHELFRSLNFSRFPVHKSDMTTPFLNDVIKVRF